ncbi:MAG: hypothetical protein HYS08_03360 [Chlamydiae bacterium]|nr:hypothetical protein [Chlamydiota bacterium]MBI3266885.1 hypothetical protein [Chlamydiota bacterium]
MNKINLSDFSSTDTKIKYACAKQTIAISKDNPSELYPDFDFFAKLLDSPNSIFKWTAIQIIGYLSRVDKKKKVDKLLPRLIDFLNGGKMITANNTILCLSEIALNKPEYQDRIINELLKIENYDYETAECRNIALGKVILALGKFKGQIKNKKEVLNFLEKQTGNTRNATKKKAHELLGKLKK